MRYLKILSELHARLKPETYLEIGVRLGKSLALSRCLSVGIDPAFAIERELRTEVHLFRTTSDEYFAREDPLAPTGGRPFDLSFIDGMHLFEFALRDFINAERHSRTTSVIVIDDVLPRTVEEAARERITTAWAGDIYPMLGVLAKYRPEVTVITVDTEPTGLILVCGLDPSSTVLADHYDDILREFRHSDPQPVPQEILDRTFAQQPRRVLASPLLEMLAEARRHGGGQGLAGRLREAAASSLGPTYA